MSDVVRFIPRVRLLVLDSIPGKSVTPSDWDVHGVFIKHRVVKESVSSRMFENLHFKT